MSEPEPLTFNRRAFFQRGEVDAAPLASTRWREFPLGGPSGGMRLGGRAMGIFSSELSIVSQPPTAGEISQNRRPLN